MREQQTIARISQDSRNPEIPGRVIYVYMSVYLRMAGHTGDRERRAGADVLADLVHGHAQLWPRRPHRQRGQCFDISQWPHLFALNLIHFEYILCHFIRA